MILLIRMSVFLFAMSLICRRPFMLPIGVLFFLVFLSLYCLISMTKVFNIEPLAVGELFTMCVSNAHGDLILRISAQIVSKNCTHISFINFGCPLAALTNQYQVFNNFLAQYLAGTHLRDIEQCANPGLF